MKHLMKPVVLAAAAVIFSGPVWAGGTAVIGTGNAGEQATLEYDGDKIRLEAPQQGGMNGYLVIDGNKAYAVSLDNGQPVVLDMASMGRMMGAMAGAAGQPAMPLDALAGEVLELRRQDRTETVAGISGQLYQVEHVDDKGNRQTDEAVLSSDPRALELTRSMVHLSRVLTSALGQPNDALDKFSRMLLDDNLGLLRMGQDMRLISLSGQTPAAERFVLPAAPGGMPDFGVLLEQAAEQTPQAMEALGEMLKALEEMGGR